MKRLQNASPLNPVFFFLSLALMFGGIAYGQFGGITPTGVNAAFFKLFGPHKHFTASADARVLDKDGNDWVRIPLNLAALDEKIVMELDLSKAVSRNLPQFALRTLKDSGMADVVSITRPDKKATFLVYPQAKSFVRLPLSADEARAQDKGFKVESKKLGRELLAGKERTKNLVVIRDDRGAAVLDATTWTAPEMREFPVQIETRQDKMTIILRFQSINLEKPGPGRFEIPAGLTQYTNVQEMMFAIMKKSVMGGGAK